ncbi:MAG: hypothetical protein HKP38_00375 [Croceitalea sp.]|nr:hypothetical protein [Croceitalea sp.]NNL07656.1 hypothetical protein [Croceitalea sp.]
MRKTIFSLLAFSLCLVFAQVNGQERTVELEGVTVSPFNLEYEYAVVDPEMPESVQELQRKVARFDVTEMPSYNGRFEAYEVLFEQDNGSIIATYDGDGKITESLERFKDIALPPAIRNHIYENNPGWTIHKDIYMISYYDDKDVQKTCKVQLRKDGQKRNLKINVSNLNQSSK